MHKELVNTTDSIEPEVKDEDQVEVDVGHLLGKEEHVEGVENALNDLVPRNTDSKEVIGARDSKIRAWMPLTCWSFG